LSANLSPWANSKLQSVRVSVLTRVSSIRSSFRRKSSQNSTHKDIFSTPTPQSVSNLTPQKLKYRHGLLSPPTSERKRNTKYLFFLKFSKVRKIYAIIIFLIFFVGKFSCFLGKFSFFFRKFSFFLENFHFFWETFHFLGKFSFFLENFHFFWKIFIFWKLFIFLKNFHFSLENFHFLEKKFIFAVVFLLEFLVHFPQNCSFLNLHFLTKYLLNNNYES